MNYSRQNFRKILSYLPPHRPIGGRSCPIGTLFRTNAGVAFDLDRELTIAIDDYCTEVYGSPIDEHTMEADGWQRMTPRELEGVLDMVERKLPVTYTGLDHTRTIMVEQAERVAA